MPVKATGCRVGRRGPEKQRMLTPGCDPLN
jgi:hypothetical protein